MKWFQHDTNTNRKAKIKKLILKHGAEGYAIYFHCLELIAEEITDNNITFELEHDAEIIADNLKIKGNDQFSAIDKVNNIMKTIVDLKLFQENNNKIACLQLAKRINSSLIKNPKLKEIKEKIVIFLNSIDDKKSISQRNVSEMSAKIFARVDKTRVDKTRVDKKKTLDDVVSVKYLNINNINNIYSLYPSRCILRNRSTGKSKKNKNQIKNLLKNYSEKYLIECINLYIKDCNKTKTYIKNFETFLNNLPDLKELKELKNDFNSNQNEINTFAKTEIENFKKMFKTIITQAKEELNDPEYISFIKYYLKYKKPLEPYIDFDVEMLKRDISDKLIIKKNNKFVITDDLESYRKNAIARIIKKHSKEDE